MNSQTRISLNERLADTARRDNRRDVTTAAVLLILAVLYPLLGTTFQLQLLTSGLITGMVAMSFSLLAGFGGMVSLAQMGFYGMAAYVVGIGGHAAGLPALLTVPLAVLSAAVLAGLFGLIAVRSSGIYFLIMTLALLQMFFGVAMQWQSVTGGYNGIAGIPAPTVAGVSLGDATPLYLVTVIVAAASYLGLRWVLRTPFGLTLQGIRDRPERTRALGFRVQLHRWLLMVLSGVIAGLAGVLGVYYHGVVSPDVAGLTASLIVVLSALVGGVSSLVGGLIGGILVTVLISVVSYLMQQWFGTSHYWTVVGLIFVVVVKNFPNGIFGVDARTRRVLERVLTRWTGAGPGGGERAATGNGTSPQTR